MSKSKFSGLFDAKRRAEEDAPEGKRGRGRPRGHAGGKRDDPDYTQASAYVLKKIHDEVKKALIDEDKEYSELIEELLKKWLESRK